MDHAHKTSRKFQHFAGIELESFVFPAMYFSPSYQWTHYLALQWPFDYFFSSNKQMDRQAVSCLICPIFSPNLPAIGTLVFTPISYHSSNLFRVFLHHSSCSICRVSHGGGSGRRLQLVGSDSRTESLMFEALCNKNSYRKHNYLTLNKDICDNLSSLILVLSFTLSMYMTQSETEVIESSKITCRRARISGAWYFVTVNTVFSW